MSKKTDLKLLKEKIAEVHAQHTKLKTDDTLAKTTRGTKLYKLSRDERVLELIMMLMRQLPGEFLWNEYPAERETFLLLTTLASERKRTIEVHEGDKLLDLMTQYADTKDLLAKLQKAADAAGCVLDFQKGIVTAKPVQEK